MNRNVLKILLAVFGLMLAAELAFLGYMSFRDPASTPETTPPTTEAPQASATETTAPAAQDPTIPGTTETPTEATETEPTGTEPTEVRYLLSFAGDCTLGSNPNQFSSPHSFVGTVGENYEYPFQQVRDIFEADDFTIVNLESVLADKGAGGGKLFTFRGPTAYTQILTSSSVEAVTLANNHTEDFGKDGYASTTQALTAAGVWFVEEDKTTLVTTESGLTIGLYADSFYFSNADIQRNVKKLRDQGAEIVICAFHWGTEGSYRANKEQEGFAHAAIDAGADIVYGHHPHVLQKIESYKNGVIFYSLGNFSFGGNTFPRDKDSAIVQMEVIRDVEGNVKLGEMNIIPVSISSNYKTSSQNNFQPIPYEEGSQEYERTLSKLDGSFTGPDLNVDYSFMNPTEPPETPTEAPTTPPENPGTEPPATQPEEGGSQVTEPAESGDEDTPPPDQGGEDPPAPDEGGEDTPAPDEGGGDTPAPDAGGEDTPAPDAGSGDTPGPGDGGSEGGEDTPPPPPPEDAGGESPKD